MLFDASQEAGRRAYQLMTDTIVPRPIAWVSTLSADGLPNLAPFSFFMGVSSRPPTLALSIATRVQRQDDGRRLQLAKHTLLNLRERREFVVHVAPSDHHAEVVQSAVHRAPQIDEFARLGFTPASSRFVSVPRVAELPVAMECRLLQEIPVGDPPTALVLGEILGWHVRDDLLDEDGRIHIAGLRPLARLGVDGYPD